MSDITFDSSFGERGVGSGQFQYPGGLVVVDSFIFVCDTQNNRVLQLSNVGLQIREIGVGILNYPHSIVYNSGKLYVSDSANHRIAVFSTIGVLIGIFGSEGSGEGQFSYPSGVTVYGDYLFVVDTQNNRVQKLLKTNGSFLSEITTDLEYPFGISTQGNQLILSQPNEIRLYDIEPEPSVDYTSLFDKLNNQLFPTGRAWWKLKGSVFSNLMEGLALSESRVQNDIIKLQNDFFADSTLMSFESVDRWNYVLGLKGVGTQNEQLSAIYQRQAFPNNTLARQSNVYIQQQLQLAGFDVYVYSQYYNPQASLYDNCTYDSVVYDKGNDSYTLLVDNVDESLDQSFVLVDDGLRATAFVGGETLGSYATVPIARKNEFRELMLRLKPAQVVMILYINYI